MLDFLNLWFFKLDNDTGNEDNSSFARFFKLDNGNEDNSSFARFFKLVVF